MRKKVSCAYIYIYIVAIRIISYSRPYMGNRFVSFVRNYLAYLPPSFKTYDGRMDEIGRSRARRM